MNVIFNFSNQSRVLFFKFLNLRFFLRDKLRFQRTGKKIFIIAKLLVLKIPNITLE